MRALQRLTAPRFAKEGWVGSSVVAESLGVVARAAGRSAEAAAPSPALLEASAGVLEQLSATAAGVASPETFEGIVSAAEALVAVRQSSVLGLTAALQAMSHQLVAAATEPGNDETYINLLSRCLAASLAVLKSSTSSAEQHTAAAGQVVATARAAAARPSTVHSSGGPLAEDVLSSAAVTAADQALKAAEKASAVQAGANVTCVLALGAVATGGSPDPVLDNGKAMDDEMGDVTAQPESNGTNDHGDDWGNSWEEAALSSYISGGVAAVSPAQAHCLAALAAVVGSPDPGVRQACLESAAAALQRHPPPQWAAQCAAACLPPSLTVLHAALHAPDGGINTEAEVGAAVAALQFGSLCCGLGGDAGAAALSIAVPVLVESAAPRAGTIPALAEAAVKQLAALASGPSASAFRAAVAALPDATKQRLQHALASVATGRAAAAPAPAPGPLRADPSIQLKMFGAPK